MSFFCILALPTSTVKTKIEYLELGRVKDRALVYFLDEDNEETYYMYNINESIKDEDIKLVKIYNKSFFNIIPSTRYEIIVED